MNFILKGIQLYVSAIIVIFGVVGMLFMIPAMILDTLNS